MRDHAQAVQDAREAVVTDAMVERFIAAYTQYETDNAGIFTHRDGIHAALTAALADADAGGDTVQLSPLLTDADRKVLEAAEEEECAFDLYKKAIERKEYQNDAAFELWQANHIRYREAVRARRAAMDHVADAGKKGEA